MSGRDLVQASTGTQVKFVLDGCKMWKGYWTAVHKQLWRTEPEIDEKRRQYLATRRAVNLDIEMIIYSFHDENGSIKLERAGVE
jgi:hypothetical protein